MAEQTKEHLAIIHSDLGKAFDKVSPEKLIEVLDRMKVPPRMLTLINITYKTPQFAVKVGENESEYLRQRTGMRKGCPLSPYLFTPVMTMMMRNIKTRLNTPAQKEPLPGIEFAEVLYADDTLLFGKHTQTINRSLKEIQIESEYQNMKLNCTKCINLTIDGVTSSIIHKIRQLVPRKQKAVYLGPLLTDTNDDHAKINNRISDS